MLRAKSKFRTEVRPGQANGERWVTVATAVAKETSKRILIREERKATIDVQRFACVGPGDRLVLSGQRQRKISVLDESEELIPVWPPFEKAGRTTVGGASTPYQIVEPISLEDFSSYENLEAFHYRGVDLSAPRGGHSQSKKKRTGGRRVVLLMKLKIDGAWIAAGYIELQMPLMMAKPRHVALNRPFNHPTLNLKWNTWVKGGSSLVNRIARIARVVVNPELRGSKVSRPLLEAAINFARERWHIGGKRPVFLEISAEMLRYVDFVSSSGFHFLGTTEGNRARLVKDLASVNNGAGGASGIMSLQRKYHAFFEAHRSRTGDSFESLRARLDSILKSEDPMSAMTLDEWAALRPIIRSPIPYYMIGLDSYSDQYLAGAVVPRAGTQKPLPRLALERIELKELSVDASFDLPTSRLSREVMDGFGLIGDNVIQHLVGPISHCAQAGSITFIAGSSGCGKSVLLTAVDPTATNPNLTVTGELVPPHYRAAWLRPPPEDSLLFEHLAQSYGAERAFDALARVGLSEALLFLKPFAMLSRGQRYRAMLAGLMLEDADVWLIDEFCSDLDPLSARIVANKLRDTVRRERRIALVAAANHQHFIDALKPDMVLKLKTGGGLTKIPGREYRNGILN